VWCLRPAPPFWPEPGEMGEACEDHEVGPWLDFEDMFLTSRVLMRALSELVGLLGALAGLLPEEETGGCRRRISGTAQAAGLREAAAAAAARRAPWLRASPCEAPTARQELVAPPLSEAQAALDRALWSEATALVRSSLKSRGRAARCIQRAFRARAAHRADGPAAPSPSGEAPSIPSSAGAARAPSGGTKNNIIIEARRSARTPEFLCLCRPSLPYPRTLARRARRPLCARAAPRPTARLSGRSIAGQGGRGAPACGPAPRRRRPWTARNDRGEDSGTPELGLAGALCRARPGRILDGPALLGCLQRELASDLRSGLAFFPDGCSAYAFPPSPKVGPRPHSTLPLPWFLFPRSPASSFNRLIECVPEECIILFAPAEACDCVSNAFHAVVHCCSDVVLVSESGVPTGTERGFSGLPRTSRSLSRVRAAILAPRRPAARLPRPPGERSRCEGRAGPGETRKSSPSPPAARVACLPLARAPPQSPEIIRAAFGALPISTTFSWRRVSDSRSSSGPKGCGVPRACRAAREQGSKRSRVRG
ncbi:unnamed protein product, partial [Prorocentrum cordatum]